MDVVGVGCTRGTGGSGNRDGGRTNKPPQLKGGLDQCEPGSSVWLILCVSSAIEQSVPEYVKTRNWRVSVVLQLGDETTRLAGVGSG